MWEYKIDNVNHPPHYVLILVCVEVSVGVLKKMNFKGDVTVLILVCVEVSVGGTI